MNMAITLTLLLAGFTLALCGVIVLFEVDVWLGFMLAVIGISASIGATLINE